MLFIFSMPVLIRHLWQPKTVVFLHWCLMFYWLLAIRLPDKAHLKNSLKFVKKIFIPKHVLVFSSCKPFYKFIQKCLLFIEKSAFETLPSFDKEKAFKLNWRKRSLNPIFYFYFKFPPIRNEPFSADIFNAHIISENDRV
jgi:hypothetical protein